MFHLGQLLHEYLKTMVSNEKKICMLTCITKRYEDNGVQHVIWLCGAIHVFALALTSVDGIQQPPYEVWNIARQLIYKINMKGVLEHL